MAAAPGFQVAMKPSGVIANTANSVTDAAHCVAQYSAAGLSAFSLRGMVVQFLLIERRVFYGLWQLRTRRSMNVGKVGTTRSQHVVRSQRTVNGSEKHSARPFVPQPASD